MPELSNPIAGLYPQPPQQSGSLLSDPLGTIGRLQQLSLIGKTLAAKQAIGEAYSSNLNPDGTPNLPGVAATLKNNPNAQFGMQEAASTMLAQHGQQISNDTAAADLNFKQSGFAQQWLASRASQPNVTKEDILNDAVTLARNSDPKVLPSSVINSVVSTILSDPGGVHAGLVNLQNRVMGAGNAASRIPGPPNAAGAPTSIPLGTAGYPGALPVGNPPGTEASATSYQGDLARAGQYASDIYPLNKALDLAQKLGPGGMGPGTQGRQAFESFVYSLVPQLVPQGMQDKIKNYAELEKYLVNNTQNRAQNLGPHTNEGLATAVTGSPNVHINDLAGIDLIKAQIALRRMEQAQTLSAAKSGPAGYTAARSTFSANQDPRAYAIDMMPPAEIANLQKTLKGAERARFNASLKAAIDAGVITPPGQ